MELNSCVGGIKIYFNMIPRRMKKSHFPLKRPTISSFGNTLIISGYKAIKISIFHKLVVKLWLAEDGDLQK